ncbi:MAG: Rab5-interacting family protein [Candidatus Heimdallarchaeota archaeon]|nr:Rab5-interacting family protein [Candidatus Heimdallarchaeota archaeon]
MSKKNPKQKVSSSSSNKEKNKKDEKINLEEYEDSFNGKGELPQTTEEEYEDYDLPEDFVPPKKDEIADKEMSWFKRKLKGIEEMENTQRLYWIKILTASIAGVLLGLFGAQKGWWLLLMLGLYAAVTTGGFYLFKLNWNFKEIIFSGLFPFLALFTLFWVLIFSSLYAPTMAEWFSMLKVVITTTVNGTEFIYTSTRTTQAAGFPFISIIITILSTFGLLQFLVRRQNRKTQNE